MTYDEVQVQLWCFEILYLVYILWNTDIFLRPFFKSELVCVEQSALFGYDFEEDKLLFRQILSVYEMLPDRGPPPGWSCP